MTSYADARARTTQAAIRARILQTISDADTPVAGWSDHAPQRVLVDDASAFLADEANLRADLAASIDITDPSLTDEDWIDLFASFFSETRIPALAAVWDVPMTGATLPATVSPSTKITLQASGGAFFDLTQSASAVLPAPLRFAARVPGTSGNVPPSTITRVITGPAGLTFNGARSLYTAGRDRESNVALVRRCLAKWAVRGAGWTAQAFDYFVPKAAPSVTDWRVNDSNPDGPGTTRVTLANAAGAATGPEVAAVQALCFSRGVRTLGSGALASQAAGVLTFVISGILTVDGTNANAAAEAEAAVLRYCRWIGIGPARLVVDRIYAAIVDVAGVVNFEPTSTLEPGAANLTPIDSIVIPSVSFTTVIA